MTRDRPALLERYPELASGLAHRPFLTGPTPVRPFPVAGVPEGRLYCKDDSLSCPLYGGNKPRKLEWLIGAAVAGRSRRLVTTGGLGTHHGLATTILGRSAGLATSLVLVDQPWTSHVEDTLRLHAAYGAEQIAAGRTAGAVVETVRVLARSTLAGERPRLVPTGGSSALGNLGFVSAGLELGLQVSAGALPRPAAIYLAVGSGGTAAGLSLGLRLADLAVPIVGVLVTDILAPSARRLRNAARASARLIARHVKDFRAPAAEGEGIEIVRDQLGAGYGAPTPEAEDALEAAAEVGTTLDTTYTAKCLAAILARARSGRLEGGPILFWNTLNAVDVWKAAPTRCEEVTLPAAVQARRARLGVVSDGDDRRSTTGGGA
ncbi:MAG: 1-aminocyclopropane-1-carboxylate deaminase/D-cysteine desulfhydrase [Myxococcota bacterium]